MHWLESQSQQPVIIFFLAYIHLLLQSYCSNISNLNAFVAEFNSIKAIFSNKTLLLRGNASKKYVEMHMKSCFLLHQNAKVVAREELMTGTILVPAIVF